MMGRGDVENHIQVALIMELAKELLVMGGLTNVIKMVRSFRLNRIQLLGPEI